MRAPRSFGILVAWAMAAGAFAVGCGGGGGGSTPPSAFRVTQTAPADQDSDVALNSDILISFSRPVDPATVTRDTVAVTAEDGSVVLGDRSVPPLSPALVRFVPRTGYLPYAIHRVHVTAGVHGVDGAALQQDYEFIFQAEAAGPVLPTQNDVEDLGDLLVTGRWFHRMVRLPNNRFLVAGGYQSDNTVTDSAEILVPALKTSTQLTARLLQARAAHLQLPLADGRVLLAGGESSNTPFVPLAGCEIYDPVTQTFSAAASMEKERSFAAGVLLPDGRVLVTGGQGLEGTTFVFRDDAEIYDPVDDLWTLLTSKLSQARSAHAMRVAPDGTVVVVGGDSSTPGADRWDPSTGEFTPLVPTPLHPHYFAATTPLSGGRLLLVGGINTVGTTIWDPAIGFLNGLNAQAGERSFATATPLPDGRVVIVGGLDLTVLPTLIHGSIEIFFPIGQSGKVFRVPGVGLPVPTTHHAAAADADGAVWITGGLPADLALPGLRRVTVIHPD